MVQTTNTNVKDYGFDSFVDGYICSRIRNCETKQLYVSIDHVITLKNDNLLPKYQELEIIRSLLKSNKFIIKKYAYKTLQFHIVEMRQYFNSLNIEKPQKIANLPDYVNFFNIADYTKLLNQRFGCSFDNKLLSLAIDKYLSNKMAQVEDQEDFYKVGKNIFPYSDMNKTTAKFQELVLDKQYHNYGYVSAKTLWLTFQYLIEHVIDCGRTYTVRICTDEVNINLPDIIYVYDANSIISALNDYLTNIDSIAA